MAQTLIDLRVIQRYFSGNDEDRKVIQKLYPELNWEDLKLRVVISFAQDLEPIHYPVSHNGKTYDLVLTITPKE